MEQFVWMSMAVLALVFQFYWMRFESRIPVTTLPAAFLWFWWGFNAMHVEHGSQVVVTNSYPSLRYLGYFFGIMNLALLGLWLWVDEDESVFEGDW